MWFNHSMQPDSFTHILFDWGDTVMYDDPAIMRPMVEWPEVRMVPGIDKVLTWLKSTRRMVVLATSANISDEAQIRAALARVDVAQYVDKVYCFKNTGLPKGEPFYRKVISDLGIEPSNALMIGDTFEKDVLAANAVGILAIWFNERTKEERNSEKHITTHSMNDLLEWFSKEIRENL
jgi:putative hydrolase of the HAD superfamily